MSRTKTRVAVPEPAIDEVSDMYERIITSDECSLSDDCARQTLIDAFDVADKHGVKGEDRRQLLIEGFSQAFDRIRDRKVRKFRENVESLTTYER